MAITSVNTIVPIDIPNQIARLTSVITDSEDTENPITVSIGRADLSTAQNRSDVLAALKGKYDSVVAKNVAVDAIITAYESQLTTALDALLNA